MKRMKLAAAALNQTPIAWEQNCQNILSAIAQAKAQQVDLLCLPELCISGYGCEDAFMSQGVLATSLELLVEDLISLSAFISQTGAPARPQIHGKAWHYFILGILCAISVPRVMLYMSLGTRCASPPRSSKKL